MFLLEKDVYFREGTIEVDYHMKSMNTRRCVYYYLIENHPDKKFKCWRLRNQAGLVAD